MDKILTGLIVKAISGFYYVETKGRFQKKGYQSVCW